MKSEYQHKVLIVDNDDRINETINQVLQMEKIQAVFADSGESALEEIKKTNHPFSLIIADQNLPGMKGTEFFEHTKKLTPETARFMTTDHMQVETIINAVNKGAIQRYNLKPWQYDDLVEAIKTGIKQYEFFLDYENLLTLAKKQNAELYELACELTETTKSHGRILHELDNDIERIKKEIKNLLSHPTNPDIFPDEIEKIETLFSETIKEMYCQFKELGYRNGFDMPYIKYERK
ncbi:response regulator [Desulfobacula phenolica]|uniref:Response regulator receiver domain-containing protein n=1 Tax=Desulfobacula phenolica TaxID=90732 RepID=A0A1H2JYA2_9BACT|nr:response regulator [Desulfobacula phenolica]SDU61263.1 Response regulator receiver domain-containing protein [Desulfobacula phenolica]